MDDPGKGIAAVLGTDECSQSVRAFAKIHWPRCDHDARANTRSDHRVALMQVRVHCLALGGVDLTSPAGKMTMAVIAAVAEFERDLLVERTQAGLTRAKAEGKKLGRPSCLTPEQQEAVQRRRADDASLGTLAKKFGVSPSTIQRLERPA